MLRIKYMKDVSLKVTPLMKQYQDIKKNYPDAILLFRLGDFYETFGDDAKKISSVLNITLTSRDKKNDPTPLAGFPHHALTTYANKLLKANLKVVIAEQMEDPATAKGLVKRQVTEVITPGTVYQEGILNATEYNFLGCVLEYKRLYGVAFLDLSVGKLFFTELSSIKEVISEIQRYNPKEIITNINFAIEGNFLIQHFSDKGFEITEVDSFLQKVFNVHNTGAIGLDDYPISKKTIFWIMKYIYDNGYTNLKHIDKPKIYSINETMILDKSTVLGLELLNNDGKNNNFFSVINCTITSLGARKLQEWILHPLKNKTKINARLDSVEYFYNNNKVLEKVISLLKGVYDIDRLCGRIGLRKAVPNDLICLKDSLEKSVQIYNTVEIKGGYNVEISKIDKVIEIISNSIDVNAGNNMSEGFFIKSGYNELLDNLRSILVDQKNILLNYENQERQSTGIPTLRVSYNQVVGYYIEVTKKYSNLIPDNYVLKQSLTNVNRYLTAELKDLELKIVNAKDKLIAVEVSIFNKLLTLLENYIEDIKNISYFISDIDIFSCFATISRKYNYTRPVICSNNCKKIFIKDGRHPVVGNVLGSNFVPNSTSMNQENFVHIITGPNMSGKSTYLRQVAMITLMAQIGCFVPAEKLELSVVDRIFTRIGSGDDIASGRSTFMVEMSELANILSNATENSLLILDEIGRGTSTYDGLSIAWSTLEYISQNLKARTIFATHYHEVINLSSAYENIRNYHVEVFEDVDSEKVSFLYTLKEGPSDKSYGIYVAKIAGLPESIINRAWHINSKFEGKCLFKDNYIPKIGLKIKPIYLFNENKNTSKYDVLEKIKNIKIEEISPLQSFEILKDLIDRVKKEG